MTLIFCDGKSMAADSGRFHGGLVRSMPTGTSKIVRAPDGSLFGAAGDAEDCEALREWVLAGMNWAKLPELRCLKCADASEARVKAIWLRHDGKLFEVADDMRYCETAPPAFCGDEHAGLLAHGAMLAGASLLQAMNIAIENCYWTAGPVHLLHLNQIPGSSPARPSRY